MKSFLQEVAESLKAGPTPIDQVTVVFPNRRAVIHFRKQLAALLDKPAFAPRLTTIEDFIAGFSPLQVIDKLELIHALYQSYQSILETTEPFDQFYFWGEMLLRDFEELDKYLIPPDQVFQDLRNQKELDSLFDYLTDQQKEFLQSFWSSFSAHDNVSKQRFIKLWTQLPAIYKDFHGRLRQQGFAYEGMQHRDVVHLMEQSGPEVWAPYPEVIFAGFNALTRAEEAIMKTGMSNTRVRVFWDVDEYYLNNSWQEAGLFFRRHQKDLIFGPTFPGDIPAHFRGQKNIQVFGAAQPTGQAKFMARILQQQLAAGMVPEETVVVLPDEKLLFPVLNGLAESVDTMNVTMGFPLVGTPLFNLIELIVELQISAQDDLFNHRQVLAILGHPYGVSAGVSEVQAMRKKILEANWIHVEGKFLRLSPSLFQLIFTETTAEKITSYLTNIVTTIGTLELSSLDKTYAYHFLALLNRLDRVYTAPKDVPAVSRRAGLRAYLRLFRQLVKTEKLPFIGEPLKGLQVMGVLETRSLDFRNVFLLSLNEGVFPSFGNRPSYLPHNIRRAYELPTVEHQDAMYAYLFYRLLQRAENVYLFYNSETDVLGQGEMSRYLRQIRFEAHPDAAHQILHNPVKPQPATPIEITKDQKVFDQLAQYCTGHPRPGYLSPTALNDYVECPLRFFFKYVARIKEPKEVEEELDARVLGNFLHETMELFYLELIQEKKSRMIDAQDFDQHVPRLQRIIDQVVRKAYNLEQERPVVYEGQRLVIREVIMSFAEQIVAMDKAYAPFQIEALETKELQLTFRLSAEGNPTAIVGGKVDRVDLKEGLLRIIDYKTGKDRPVFRGGLASLFTGDKNRNKAAFQTLLYALLYTRNVAVAHHRVKPGLINRLNLFDEDFRFGLNMDGRDVEDARPLLEEFSSRLEQLLEDIYNPGKTFTQTENKDACGYCTYQSICYRH